MRKRGSGRRRRSTLGVLFLGKSRSFKGVEGNSIGIVWYYVSYRWLVIL